MYEHDLQQLGLSEKEAKVYLAVLELGPASAIQIAQKAGVNRPTAYVQIENLMRLGLMSSHEKGKKTYFAAEPPERLQELVQKKQFETEEQGKRLKEILPELQTLFDTAEERPKVRFYEGKEGIMAMADNIFKARDSKISTISSADLIRSVFTDEEQAVFADLRKVRNIQVRFLYNRAEGPFPTPPPPNLIERFIPNDKFPITSGIDIYENKVSIFAMRGKLVGVIIESKEISDTMQSVFELAWEAAKKYQISLKIRAV